MRWIALPTSLLILALNAGIASAWLRAPREDKIVVDRSELIVVAHLKEGSIQRVDQGKPGASIYEHHAILIITEVLKGKNDKKEIPVVIHYGLTPTVADGIKKNVLAGDKVTPKGVIELFDTSDFNFNPIVKDAKENNLWFLAKHSPFYGRKPGTGDYGIVEPEELQPLSLKDYYLTYLAANPETALRDFVKKNPEMAKRANQYFDHLEVQHILKQDDPAKRFDALLPFYLNWQGWDFKLEARDGIIACGKMAGEKLMVTFADPKHQKQRTDIMHIWQTVGFREVAPLLIDLLKQHDGFWAEQQLQKEWWNDLSKPETLRRREVYGEVYTAVWALKSFGDPKSKEVLELTKKRWEQINFDNKQIVEECDAALRKLAAK